MPQGVQVQVLLPAPMRMVIQYLKDAVLPFAFLLLQANGESGQYGLILYRHQADTEFLQTIDVRIGVQVIAAQPGHALYDNGVHPSLCGGLCDIPQSGPVRRNTASDLPCLAGNHPSLLFGPATQILHLAVQHLVCAAPVNPSVKPDALRRCHALTPLSRQGRS